VAQGFQAAAQERGDRRDGPPDAVGDLLQSLAADNVQDDDLALRLRRSARASARRSSSSLRAAARLERSGRRPASRPARSTNRPGRLAASVPGPRPGGRVVVFHRVGQGAARIWRSQAARFRRPARRSGKAAQARATSAGRRPPDPAYRAAGVQVPAGEHLEGNDDNGSRPRRWSWPLLLSGIDDIGAPTNHAKSANSLTPPLSPPRSGEGERLGKRSFRPLSRVFA